MAEVNSIRHFHSELSTVCTALEILFRMAGSDFEDVELAARPALNRFRDLLDQGDLIAGVE